MKATNNLCKVLDESDTDLGEVKEALDQFEQHFKDYEDAQSRYEQLLPKDSLKQAIGAASSTRMKPLQ